MGIYTVTAVVMNDESNSSMIAAKPGKTGKSLGSEDFYNQD
jgi:hypothetical protein